MYKYHEAILIVEYYSEKVIGKPLDKKENDLLIFDIEVYKEENRLFNVICYAVNEFIIYQKPIDEVAKNLNLISPKDFLKNRE